MKTLEQGQNMFKINNKDTNNASDAVHVLAIEHISHILCFYC